MGQKLYEQTQDGGIRFISHRKGEVRIPNYVYDLWFPLLGATAIGVYTMYCRLEREDVVKAMTQKRIAKMCRIGTDKLNNINEMLQECGFIVITKPEGHKRLMHWTTEIEIFDPPSQINKELIDKYAPPSGYEILSPWLESTENPNRDSGIPEQKCVKDPNRITNVVSLGLNPLDIELRSKSAVANAPIAPAQTPIILSLVDSEVISEPCTHCGEDIILKNLRKSAAICPRCKSGLYIKDADGVIICKPPQSMREHRKKLILTDIVPECPDKLSDIMYYKRDEKRILLMLSQNSGILLDCLNWAVNKYVNGGFPENQIVKNALTAAGKRIETDQKPEIRQQLAKEISPVVAQFMEQTGLSEEEVKARIKAQRDAL